MPDSSVNITEGSGVLVDTRTVGTEHRQVIIAGDPTTNANVAAVQNEDPGPTSTVQGMVVRLAGSATVIPANGTFRVFLDSATGLPAGVNTLGSMGVFFSPSVPSVSIASSIGTIAVHLSGTSGTIAANIGRVDGLVPVTGTLTGITNSVNVYIGGTAGTIATNIGTIAGTAAVFFSPSTPAVRKDTRATGTYAVVEINASARQIVASDTDRKSVVFVHDSTTTVYIGLSSLLTTTVTGNGFPLVANQIFGFDDYTGAIFGARESGAGTIKYIEIP